MANLGPHPYVDVRAPLEALRILGHPKVFVVEDGESSVDSVSNPDREPGHRCGAPLVRALVPHATARAWPARELSLAANPSVRERADRAPCLPASETSPP